MAKKFKDYYDVDCARLLAGKISTVNNDFKSEAFIRYISERLEGKTFSERQELFAGAFELYIKGGYKNTFKTFLEILGPELEESEGMFTYGWWLWPVGKYVENHGTKNPELSLDFIYELTKRFTGEFAMRPLLVWNAKKVLNVLVKWSLDENVHIRRLASECMRIRLPWAKKSFAALDDVALYKKVLSNLKNDKEKFVQKSVGNNLNDLMKDNPELAMEIISEWENDNPGKETLWIIKHGKRSLKLKAK